MTQFPKAQKLVSHAYALMGVEDLTVPEAVDRAAEDLGHDLDRHQKNHTKRLVRWIDFEASDSEVVES